MSSRRCAIGWLYEEIHTSTGSSVAVANALSNERVLLSALRLGLQMRHRLFTLSYQRVRPIESG
jgi:hypothetical protein